MIRTKITNSIGVFLLLALSACASPDARDGGSGVMVQCAPPNTMTCEEFAGEKYNCTCERGDRLGDIIDSY